MTHNPVRICALAAAVAFGLGAATAMPAAAAPITAGKAAATGAVPELLIEAQAGNRTTTKRRAGARKSATRPRARAPRQARVPRSAPPYRDTVSSIFHDGIGYGYNRFTGQRYMSCMIDEGYGRVIPCDAGNDSGSSFN